MFSSFFAHAQRFTAVVMTARYTAAAVDQVNFKLTNNATNVL